MPGVGVGIEPTAVVGVEIFSEKPKEINMKI